MTLLVTPKIQIKDTLRVCVKVPYQGMIDHWMPLT